jgi:hypothetical protein
MVASGGSFDDVDYSPAIVLIRRGMNRALCMQMEG